MKTTEIFVTDLGDISSLMTLEFQSTASLNECFVFSYLEGHQNMS